MIDYRDDARWTVYIHIVPKEISKYDHDKYYVGITSNTVKRRWENGNGYKTQSYFWNAISKYGWNNIIHEIVAEHLTKDEACCMEKLLITKLKSNYHDFGYNQTSGGDCNYSSNYSGENNPKAKPLYQFDLDFNFVESFPSSKEAKEKIGINPYDAALRGHLCANSYWFREKDVCIDSNGNVHLIKNVESNRNEIFQFNINFKYVNRYKSERQAAKNNNIAKTSIHYSAENKVLIKNYYWLFREDVDINGNEICINKYILNKIQNKSVKTCSISNCIKIVNVTKKELFHSIGTAATYYSIDSSYLRKTAKETLFKPYRKCKSYKWLLYDDYLKINNLTDEEARKRLFFIA